jgi:small subunit ribosomal protein S18
MADRKRFTRKFCRYSAQKIDYIDYKELDLLRISLSERFKIMPRRLTGNSKKHQEMAENAIKRARHMALVPYVVDRDSVVDSPFDILKPLKRVKV